MTRPASRPACKPTSTTRCALATKVRAGTLRMAPDVGDHRRGRGDGRASSDDEVLKVLAKEAKKRKEAAAAYLEAKRPELAATEEAELTILEGYLPRNSPRPSSPTSWRAVASTGASGMPQMGAVMKVAQGEVAGRADGGRVAAPPSGVRSGR